MKKSTLILLMTALLLSMMLGCTPRLLVEDHSFKISMTTELAENGKHNLYLLLEDGDPEQKYRIRYSIDDKKTVPLFLEGGSPIDQDSFITFNSGSVLTLTTGELQEIPHEIEITLFAGTFSQSVSVTTERGSVFEIESTMEFKQEDLHHYLFITLSKGDQGRRYNIEYWINDDRFYHLYDERNQPIEQGADISFGQQRLRILRIDRLPEGKNHILIKITTGMWSRYINRYFSNDVLPEVTMSLNFKDGNYYLTTPENPNSLSFSGKAKLKADALAVIEKGHYEFEKKYRHYDVTRHFERKDPTSQNILMGHRDSIANDAKRYWEWSNVYKQEFVTNKGMVWVYASQEKKNYYLSHDTLYLDLKWNPKHNIRLNLENRIENCYVNGKRLTKKGVYTIYDSVHDESKIDGM